MCGVSLYTGIGDKQVNKVGVFHDLVVPSAFLRGLTSSFTNKIWAEWDK